MLCFSKLPALTYTHYRQEYHDLPRPSPSSRPSATTTTLSTAIMSKSARLISHATYAHCHHMRNAFLSVCICLLTPTHSFTHELTWQPIYSCTHSCYWSTHSVRRRPRYSVIRHTPSDPTLASGYISWMPWFQ